VRGAREKGLGGVGGEELGAEFGEVDLLRVGGALGVCRYWGKTLVSDGVGREAEGGKYLRGGPLCE